MPVYVRPAAELRRAWRTCPSLGKWEPADAIYAEKSGQLIRLSFKRDGTAYVHFPDFEMDELGPAVAELEWAAQADEVKTQRHRRNTDGTPVQIIDHMVGRRVRRGVGWRGWSGVVAAFDKVSGEYRVDLDGGDAEFCTREELVALLTDMGEGHTILSEEEGHEEDDSEEIDSDEEQEEDISDDMNTRTSFDNSGEADGCNRDDESEADSDDESEADNDDESD
eukprot:SAG31_NODE_14504_length_803_cov_0.825284_1_plen_222_part_01